MLRIYKKERKIGLKFCLNEKLMQNVWTADNNAQQATSLLIQSRMYCMYTTYRYKQSA